MESVKRKVSWQRADLEVPLSALLLVLVIVITFYLGLQMMPPNQFFHDEFFHYPQIAEFSQGIFNDISDKLTMLPGYHAIIAGLAWLVGDHSIAMVRIITAFASLPAVLFFYLAARELGKRNQFTVTLLFYSSPIIFPYFFVIYTDMTSLMLILASFFFTLKRQYQIAALFALASLFVRQTNIIWAFLFSLIALGQEGTVAAIYYKKWKQVFLTLSRLWIFILSAVLFLAYVKINGGVAAGDKGAHELNRIYPTQVYLLLFTVFFLFLPMHLKNTPKIFAMIRKHPEWLVIAALLFVVYITTFWAHHMYNHHDFFLRNRILIWIREDFWTKSLAFIPMIWAFLSLCVTPLRRKSFYWLYPISIIALLPHGLVEQRYFLVFLALFMLMKRWDSIKVDYLTIAYYAPVTLFLCIGIGKIHFFL